MNNSTDPIANEFPSETKYKLSTVYQTPKFRAKFEAFGNWLLLLPSGPNKWEPWGDRSFDSPNEALHHFIAEMQGDYKLAVNKLNFGDFSLDVECRLVHKSQVEI